MSLDLWQRGCERLAAELPEQQFNTWIRPLAPVPRLPSAPTTGEADDKASGTDLALDDEVVAVQVPNRFKLDWIRSQYAARIESALTAAAGKPVRLELTLAPRSDTPSPGHRPGPGGPTNAATLASQALGTRRL